MKKIFLFVLFTCLCISCKVTKDPVTKKEDSPMFDFLKEKTLDEELFKAVTANDLTKVKYLIEQKNADVNYIRKINKAFFIPVLMEAVMKNHTDIATYLIKKGANVNIRDGFKMTSLMWAANNENIELVRLLIENGADIYAEDDNGLNALKAAKDKNNQKIIDLLNAN